MSGFDPDRWLEEQLAAKPQATAASPAPPATMQTPAWFWLLMFNVFFLVAVVWWSQFRQSPGPDPAPVVVIEEAADAAEAMLKLEAANYAKVQRRLAEQVVDGTIKDRKTLADKSIEYSKAARDNAATKALGPVDNKYLPEDTFAGQSTKVADYLTSVAVGFERIAK